MNDNLAQQAAQTPSPSTGSRQATHSVGSAMSSARRAAYDHATRHVFTAPRRWLEMERDGEVSASIRGRLAPPRAVLKSASIESASSLRAKRSNPSCRAKKYGLLRRKCSSQ